MLKADKAELTAGLKEKQNAQYLSSTITDIDSFIALNQTDTIYTGMISGFSTKFGATSDSVVKGFRMWFVLSQPNNSPVWYRVIMFDDGAIWTASIAGKSFLQVGYSKAQVNKLLTAKADKSALPVNDDGYVDSTNLAAGSVTEEKLSAEVLSQISNAAENVIVLPASTGISSAEQLNDYTDTNKTYLFYVIPSLATELQVGTPTLCTLNNYGDYQVIRTVTGVSSKTFCRSHNTSNNTWSNFTDTTIHDNAVTLPKLSSDVQKIINSVANKPDAEYGSGSFTCDEGVNVTENVFRYQRVGRFVTLTVKVTAGEDIAANTLTLSGLPYINNITGVYLKILSTRNNDISVQIPYTTGQMKVMSALVSGEALVFTFTYQIS